MCVSFALLKIMWCYHVVFSSHYNLFTPADSSSDLQHFKPDKGKWVLEVVGLWKIGKVPETHMSKGLASFSECSFTFFSSSL